LRVLGPAGAASLIAKFAGVVAHQERAIYRFNPELSFFAAP